MQTVTLPMTAPPPLQHMSRFTRISVVPMWKDTTVATNGDGQEEAYSIAPDGFVWSYTIDAERGRTGRLITTGLRANTFALGKSPDGRNIVIAGDGAMVRFVVETGDPKQRWSAPRAVSFPPAQQKVAVVEKLFIQILAGNLFVRVLSRHPSAIGEEAYQFWEGIWTGTNLVFSHSPLKIEHQKNIWLQKLFTSNQF